MTHFQADVIEKHHIISFVLIIMIILLIILSVLTCLTVFTGTSPIPRIWTVNGTNNRQLLQCDVDGAFPKPTVVLLDSSGGRVDSVETKSVIEDNRFYVTVQANVTKTDTYSCVATQEEIYHQIHDDIHVYVQGQFLCRDLISE